MNLIPTIKKILPAPLFRAMRKTYYAFTDETVHTDFNVRTIYTGHQLVTYRGVKAIRCPFDYVLYQMIINEVKPDLIIEVGTHQGGSALYFADMLEKIGNGVIHTIDIEPMVTSSLVKDNPRIKLFTDGWQKYDIAEAKGFSNILVIEDGSHTYEDSIGAMEKFAPLVAPGSYLIVEDGILDEIGLKDTMNGGPVRAIDEFIPKNSEFFIDRKWCDFFGKNATFNVNGYLKRKG